MSRLKRECGSSYYLNKRRQSGPDGTTWHVFYAWDQGIPEEISNKSGKCVLSVAFLTQVALTLSRMRVGFTAICNVYNDTVLRYRGHGSPPLAVDTLLECWSLLATLKMAQGVGPWLTFPPEGLTLAVGNPRLVWVRDIDGEQSGANHWVSTQLRPLRQTIEVDGQLCSIKAAVIDGITNTRGPCCAVHECTHDLPNLSGARFCEHHAPIYEHRCAVTSPECLNDHEDGSLACAEHADMERRWKFFNNFGDYRRKQRMRAAGIEVEPDDIKLLRVMFSRRNSYGHLVGTLNCGIISGISALAAHEGMECVCAALDLMWPDPLSRPGILFYGLACRLLEYRLWHPHLGWLMCRYIVDRFHFRSHNEINCAIINSPEARDDSTLWRTSPEGQEEFRWNSSRAESSNSWLEGFGVVVKQMPQVLRDFFLNHAILVRNETLLRSKLMSRHPNFDG